MVHRLVYLSRSTLARSAVPSPPSMPAHSARSLAPQHFSAISLRMLAISCKQAHSVVVHQLDGYRIVVLVTRFARAPSGTPRAAIAY